MALTKEQRSAAAKKAAATRKRNQAKGSAQRLERQLGGLKRTGKDIAENVKEVAKTAGSAAKTAAEERAHRAVSGARRD
jgi:hypothetical protein